MNNAPSQSSASLDADARSRRSLPDWLAISVGVLLGELHRLILATLLAAMAMIVTVGRGVKTHIATFLIFDLLFQWLGLLIIFLVAMVVSRSRSTRCAHWLAGLSLVLGIGVRLATGQYATGAYPLWYELAFPLGTVFAWAVALRYVAGGPAARS